MSNIHNKIETGLGLITGSEVWKLMPAALGKITPESELSVGAKTYIEERFWMLADGFSPDVKASSLQYGIDHEPIALAALSGVVGQPIERGTFLRHELGFFGCTPDTKPVMYNGEIHSAEIKCPSTGRSHRENREICISYKNETNHWMDSVWVKKYPELFWQTQMEMYMDGTKKCIFMSYHDTSAGLNLDTDIVMCVFNRRDEAIELLLMQLKKAWAYYQEYASSELIDGKALDVAKVLGIEKTKLVPIGIRVDEPGKMEMEHAGLQVNMDAAPAPEKTKKETAKERKAREEKEFAEKLVEYTAKLQACTTPEELDALRQKDNEPFLKATLAHYIEMRDKMNRPVAITKATAEILPNGDLGTIKGSIPPVEPETETQKNDLPARKNDALYVQFDAIKTELTEDEITGAFKFEPMLKFMMDNANYIGSVNPKPEYDADFRNYVIPFLKELGYTDWMKARVTKTV